MEVSKKEGAVVLKVEPIEASLHMGKPAEKPRGPGANGGSDGDDFESGGQACRRHLQQCCRRTFSLQSLVNVFPIARWLPQYRCDTFQADLIAGLTVGLTVIPQGLAYAQIANLPAQYGLYSAFMGGFVYALMGTAKDITLGPTAIISLMTATFASSPIQGDATVAVVLTLICGVVQLVMGMLRLGILINYISYPVINAFTSAAAITIAVGQLKNIFGLSDVSREFMHTVYDTCRKLPETNVWDMTMGIVSLIAVILLKMLRTIQWGDEDNPDAHISLPIKIARKIIWLTGTAANAIVVITAAGVVAILESQDIKVITPTQGIKAGLPPFQVPAFHVTGPSLNETITLEANDIFKVIGAGIGIVPLLAIIETMAIGKAFARTNHYKIDPTQELLAIGTANIVSSFVSSFPITGSFSRTAINSQSGVRTPFGGIWTGGLVILALCVLTPYFYYIPKSALAAVIIAAVIQMVDYKILRVLWRANKWDLVPLIITFICSLTVGIEYGILIGVGFSLLMLLYPMARPKIKYTTHSGLIIVTPMQGLNFPASEHLEIKAMEKALAGDKPKNIVINLVHMSDLDYTAVQSLRSLSADCEKKGIRMVLANGQARIVKLLKGADMPNLHVVDSMQEAMGDFCCQDESGMVTDGEEDPFVNRL